VNDSNKNAAWYSYIQYKSTECIVLQHFQFLCIRDSSPSSLSGGARNRLVCELLSIYSFELSDARVWECMFVQKQCHLPYLILFLLAVKGIVVHFYTMKAHKGSRGIVPHFLNLSVRWKYAINHILESFSSRVGETKNALKGRLGGPRRILTFCKREKTLAPDGHWSSNKKTFSLPHSVRMCLNNFGNKQALFIDTALTECFF